MMKLWSGEFAGVNICNYQYKEITVIILNVITVIKDCDHLRIH